MDIFVAPGETDAVADRERRLGEIRVAENRREIARAAALEPDLIGRALVFDAGDDG
jgi:hypothetical protein